MIAIHNMSKPKSCYNHCLEGFIANEEIGCPLKNYEESHQYKTKIHPGCPLIEIIPCKDCKNSHMTYDGECKYCDLIRDDDDNFIECYFDSDHFCSYAERK